MSSYIKTIDKKIANNDIITYKVVLKTDDANLFLGYLYKYPYNKGLLNYEDDLEDISYFVNNKKVFERVKQLNENITKYDVNNIMIINSWFHSYKNIELCKKYFDINNFPEDIRNVIPDINNITIVKCIIPKGSFYYEANENITDCIVDNDCDVIISDRIKILEEIFV